MLKKIKNFLLDIIFPLECLGCNQPGFLFCDKCFRGLEFSSTKKSPNIFTPALTKIFIAGDYDNILLAKLIKKFKYNFLSDLGLILSRWLILFWNGQLSLVESNTAISNSGPILNNPVLSQLLVIPIPLSKKRARWRGFNQAELLARPFCKNFNYPLSLNLQRQKNIPPQAKLNESERLANVHGAFTWTGANLNGQDVLLIDDVVTTGATLNEAALTLKAAGAANVYALVLAKG